MKYFISFIIISPKQSTLNSHFSEWFNNSSLVKGNHLAILCKVYFGRNYSNYSKFSYPNVFLKRDFLSISNLSIKHSNYIYVRQ